MMKPLLLAVMLCGVPALAAAQSAFPADDTPTTLQQLTERVTQLEKLLTLFLGPPGVSVVTEAVYVSTQPALEAHAGPRQFVQVLGWASQCGATHPPIRVRFENGVLRHVAAVWYGRPDVNAARATSACELLPDLAFSLVTEVSAFTPGEHFVTVDAYAPTGLWVGSHVLPFTVAP